MKVVRQKMVKIMVSFYLTYTIFCNMTFTAKLCSFEPYLFCLELFVYILSYKLFMSIDLIGVIIAPLP